MNVIVTAVIKFSAISPDGADAGDEWADNLSEAIASSVSGLGQEEFGVFEGSVSVIDWTEEVEVALP